MKEKKKALKIVNDLAYNITGYDIPDYKNFKTVNEAIQSHLDWLEKHFIDIRQSFERETMEFRED